MDREAAIRDMMDSMAQGNGADVQTKFNDLMMNRASDAINDYKQELAQSVFKNPEMQAMGLADGEEHVLEVDPAAEPETIGDENEEI
jgi:hypothetical protein